MLRPAQRRHAIGILALVLLTLGVVLYFTTDRTSSALNDLEAACLRIGPILVVIWLAYEQLKRIPVWLWCTLPVLLLALATRPRMLLVLVPLVVAAAILKPKVWPRRER